MNTIALLLMLAFGNDPFRFEPIPMGPEKLPAESAGNAATDGATGGAHDEQYAPADPRPLVAVVTLAMMSSPAQNAGQGSEGQPCPGYGWWRSRSRCRRRCRRCDWSA